MKTNFAKVCRWSLALSWFGVTPWIALASGDDSNADASKVALSTVTASAGVVLRVPVTPNGDEDSNAAVMRLNVNADGGPVTPAELPGLFDRSPEIPAVAVGDSNTSSDDSSTNWGWNRYSGWGMREPYYYYNSYTPSFNYYGQYYNFGNYVFPTYSYRTYSFPSYYDSYGYRYYYYGSGW